MSLSTQAISLSKEVRLEKNEDWDQWVSRVLTAVDSLDLQVGLLVPTREVKLGEGKDFTAQEIKSIFRERPILRGARGRADEELPEVADHDKVLGFGQEVWDLYYRTIGDQEKVKRRELYNFLVLTLGELYSEYRYNTREPGVLIARLRKQIEGPVNLQQLSLTKQLYRANLIDFEGNVSTFGTFIQSCAAKLAALGSPVSDRQKVLAFLAGLPEDQFSEIITLIMNLKEPTFPDALVRVTSFVSRKNYATDYKASLGNIDQVNYAQTTSQDFQAVIG